MLPASVPRRANRVGHLTTLALFLSTVVFAASPGFAGGGAEARGRIWHDLDRDGVQDPGEPGIEGVTLRYVRVSNGMVQETLVTDADGTYDTFGSLNDTFRLELVEPSGLDLTLQNAAGDDAIDSDFDRSTSRSPNFSAPRVFDAGLAAPELASLDLDLDFGAVVEGETLVLPAEIRNVEPHPVTLEALLINAPMSVSLGDCAPLPRILAADDVCTVDISFASANPGDFFGRSFRIETLWNLAPQTVGRFTGQSVAPIYVDPSLPPGGSGTSWADAFASLEAAVPGAANSTPVWITAGVLRPATTLLVPSNGVVVGSFSGSEIAVRERDLTAGPTTILSGDTSDDDLDPDGDEVTADADDIVGTNLARILEGDDIILDGLVLTAADGLAEGVAVHGAGFELRTVRVTGNRGVSAVRAGVGTVSVERSHFEGNDGVAFRIEGDGAFRGAKIVTVDSSQFRGNRSAGDGAAIRTTDLAEGLTIRSTLFAGNRAEGAGGAIRLEAGPFNPAMPLIIERSTFTGNEAGTVGGAISADLAAGSVIRESIAWGNDDDMGPNASTQTIDVTSGPAMVFETSDVEGSGGSSAWDPAFGTDGGGNLDVDPQFVDGESDFRLWASSPLLDLGATDPEELVDAQGAPRVEGVAADLGAFEGGVAGLRGRVWNDLDGDGLQGEGEPGIAGVQVEIDPAMPPGAMATVMTDADGTWFIADLPDGGYDVRVVPPLGFAFSPADAGPDDIDSDVDATGLAEDLPAENAPTVDAGLIAPLFADGFESGDTSAWSFP